MPISPGETDAPLASAPRGAIRDAALRKGGPIQFATLTGNVAQAAAGLTLALALAACGPRPAALTSPGARQAPAPAEAGYRRPPAVTGTQRLGGGRLLLRGSAAPGAMVRVSTPAGEMVFNVADAKGAWRLVLPAPTQVRLFGLSMIDDHQTIQAEGYLALTPRGTVAQLRAGSGARVYGPHAAGVRILALDFDRKGGAVVSGTGPPKGTLNLTVDDVARGSVTVDEAGAFSLPLNEPLAVGAHSLRVQGAGLSADIEATISAAEPIADPPFHAVATSNGWRIDWMTPAGGLQTTVLFETGEPRP